VACSLFLYAYRVKVRNLGGMSAKQWTRHQLDRLGIGRELSEIPWGTKRVKLPPSSLKPGKKVSGTLKQVGAPEDRISS
jgi:hypothetical protein